MKKKTFLIVGTIVLLTGILFLLTGCGNNNQSEMSAEKEDSVVREVGDLNLDIEQALGFSEGLAPIKKGGKWGFIDKKGNIVIDCEYDAAMPFTEGLAMVKKYEKSGFIDKEGNVVIDIKYDNIGQEGFQDGVARVYLNKDWGVIDKEGNTVVSFGKYYKINTFKNGIAQIESETARDWTSKTGYIDTKGNEIISLSLDNLGLGYFSEDLAVKSTAKYNSSSDNINGRKYGYVDTQQNLVIEQKYKGAQEFSEGLAPVTEDGTKWGYINKQGELVIDYQFAAAAPFNNGYAVVANEDKKFGIVDKEGNMVVECKYAALAGYYEGLCAVMSDLTENAKCGFINTKGEMAIDMQYDAKGVNALSYGGFCEGLAAVCKNGKWGFINYEGKTIIGNIDQADASESNNNTISSNET